MRKIKIIILFLLLTCISYKTIAQNFISQASLVGTWKLMADQQVDDYGKVIQEDKDVEGMLIYTDEGTISVQFYWRGTRRPLLNDSIMNRDGISYGLGLGKNTWTANQAKMIIDTYDAYFGRYTIDANHNTVTHLIVANLRPEKSGVSYIRKYRVEGDNLYLRSSDPKMRWQVWLVRVKK